MATRLSKAQKELIKDILRSGKTTYEEVMAEFDISRSTVKRLKSEIKKEPAPPSTSSDFKPNDLTDDFSLQEDYIISKSVNQSQTLKNQELFYEDSEEGWVYQLDKYDSIRKSKSVWWAGIVYEESAPEGWIERLTSSGNQVAISPLHDKDRWEHDSPVVVDELTGEILFEKGERYKCGDKKKAHWHIIVKTEKAVGYMEMNGFIRAITQGPYIQKCTSLKGAYEYFCHVNHPERYQYDKDEIQTFNNFVIEANKHEQDLIFADITEFITDNKHIDTLKKLMQHYRGQIEYINVIGRKGYPIARLLRDNNDENYNEKYPDGKVKLVKIVNEKGK